MIVSKLGSRRQKVYRAVQTEQGREVALKFINLPPAVEWEQALAKIDREVVELQNLVHPGLVKVYGAGVDQERVFFASELIEGESLATDTSTARI
jgi:serine/threonine protein kinase